MKPSALTSEDGCFTSQHYAFASSLKGGAMALSDLFCRAYRVHMGWVRFCFLCSKNENRAHYADKLRGCFLNFRIWMRCMCTVISQLKVELTAISCRVSLEARFSTSIWMTNSALERYLKSSAPWTCHPFSVQTIVIGTILQVIVYVLIVAARNFPMWVVGFAIYGFGTSLQVSW